MSQGGDIRPAIKKLVARVDLSDDEVKEVFDKILNGSVSDASIAAFLVALSMKGETPAEVRAALNSARKYATAITPKIKGSLVDTCGTGGDSIRSFNISTAAAIVASAAGAVVAKHGNRSVSGPCGSADFLEEIGVSLEATPQKVKRSIETVGIGFLFAPVFHPAMKNASNARKAVGVRTVFNMIGPLSNPCTNLTGQVIGVFEPRLLDLFAEVCQGYLQDAMVVHAADGFDELSNTCENDILLIKNGGAPQRLRVHPKVLNITLAKPERLVVNSKEESIKYTLQAIYGRAPPEHEDIVAMNASAALVVAGLAIDLREGITLARKAIRDGRAREKLAEFVEFSGKIQRLKGAEERFLRLR